MPYGTHCALACPATVSDEARQLWARLSEAWTPLVQAPKCKAVPVEQLETAADGTVQVAKLLAGDEGLRHSMGATAPGFCPIASYICPSLAQQNSIWPNLKEAFLCSRNQVYCVFSGVGKGGVSCDVRANRSVELAAAFFLLVRNMCAGVPHNQRKSWWALVAFRLLWSEAWD